MTAKIIFSCSPSVYRTQPYSGGYQSGFAKKQVLQTAGENESNFLTHSSKCPPLTQQSVRQVNTATLNRRHNLKATVKI